MRKNRRFWHLEIPPHLDKQLEDYIKKDVYKTKSEFIRTAVRDRLEKERAKLDSKATQIDDSSFIKNACVQRVMFEC